MTDPRHWTVRLVRAWQNNFAPFWERESLRLSKIEGNLDFTMKHNARMAKLQKEINEGWRYPPIKKMQGQAFQKGDHIHIPYWYEYLDPRDNKWHRLEYAPGGGLLVPSFQYPELKNEKG